MQYTPTHPPGNSPAELWMYRELARIGQQQEEIKELLRLQETNVSPDKPREGDIRIADGSNWNPAVGKGVYWRNDTDANGPSWVQLMNNGGRGGYGWRDELADVITRGTAGDPTFKVFRDGIYAYAFEDHGAGTEDQVWAYFHVQHEYAPGTKIYPHIHWSINAAITGTVRWGFEYIAAKGHNQQAFPASTTVYVNQTITTQYQHMIAEVSEADAIPIDNLEPDTIIAIRFFRNSSNAADTLAGDAFGFKVDCHYNVNGQFATKNKAPNFYA
jgi:hypothetical protein